MYYALEFYNITSKRANIWDYLGIHLNPFDVINLAKKADSGSYGFLKKNGEWVMKYHNSFDWEYNLKILESKTFEFKSAFGNHYYQIIPKYESFFLKTNQIISLNTDRDWLLENTCKLYPIDHFSDQCGIREFSPWNLHLKFNI